MKREDIESLRDRVSCDAVLHRAGFAVDREQSTRRAVKYRRDGGIIIVTHGGRGWFDPLGNGKGDVFSLVAFLERVNFPDAIERIASLVGSRPAPLIWKAPLKEGPEHGIDARWRARRILSPGSGTWRYLRCERSVPSEVLAYATRQGLLREGPFSSMWAAHVDSEGRIVGWEERGPHWRGFATGGAKVLFRLGPGDASRLCVTEAAIDAMSLAAFEDWREHTLYLSTGGGWSQATAAELAALAGRPGSTLVAATDANRQGEVYAQRLRIIAKNAGSHWQRLRPPADDWNAALQDRTGETAKWKV